MASVELWWLGQSGFRVQEPGGRTIFFDPFLTPSEDRAWQAPLDPSALATAVAVLCSHGHVDHFDQPSLRAAAHTPGSSFRLVVPRPLVEAAVALGLPSERVIGAQPDEPIALDGFTIHPVASRHGVDAADAYTFGRELSGGLVRYLGYVVEIGDARVYHAGDGIPYDGQIETLRAHRPDLALLPINGRDFYRESEHNIVGNLDPREAARLASSIGARLLVPMHWEMFETNRGFPGDLVSYVCGYFPHLSVVVLGRGARFVYTPAT